MIPLTEVKSSTIKLVGHNGDLLIVFHSKPNIVYAYSGCDEETARELMGAPSVGMYFDQHMRGLDFTKFEIDVPTMSAGTSVIDCFAEAKAAGVFHPVCVGLFF